MRLENHALPQRLHLRLLRYRKSLRRLGAVVGIQLQRGVHTAGVNVSDVFTEQLLNLLLRRLFFG